MTAFLQEWWGVNEQVKETAANIAAACGVRVVVPDLYRSKIAYEAAGKGPNKPLSHLNPVKPSAILC